jgi:hypothetical protein
VASAATITSSWKVTAVLLRTWASFGGNRVGSGANNDAAGGGLAGRIEVIDCVGQVMPAAWVVAYYRRVRHPISSEGSKFKSALNPAYQNGISTSIIENFAYKCRLPGFFYLIFKMLGNNSSVRSEYPVQC